MMLQMMLQMILPFKRQNCELVIITKEDWWFCRCQISAALELRLTTVH